MKTLRIALIFTFLLVWESSDLAAALYRWTDSKGQIHYSTTPPTTIVENLQVKRRGMWVPYSGQKEEPFKTKYTAKPTRAVVNYSKQKSIILIEVKINRKITEQFMVDTGATYTIISPKLAESLNLEPNPKVPPITLQTAKGPIQVSLVNLESITIGNLEIPNVAAGIHDDTSDIPGILGLNCLDRFNMTVNSTQSQLILEPIRPLSEYTSRDCAAAREWVSRGQALNDHSEEEVNCYKKAISLCEDLLEAYAYLGDVYYYQEDYQQAIEQYLKIIRIQPDEPEVHYRLGVLYALAQKFFQAKLEFQKTLELDPNHKEAREYLEQMKR